MEQLSLAEKIHSTRNRLFWSIRSAIRFQRAGYAEHCTPMDREKSLSDLSAEARSTWLNIENRYAFQQNIKNLSLSNYQKNLFTLWALEEMFPTKLPVKRILEVGAQDFSRLQAYQRFFANAVVAGIEIDPYPVLHEFHSRMDKANYYISLSNRMASLIEGDFFQLAEENELILCFYPFVSANPALAWGLPAQLGNPVLWLKALDRNLGKGGQALIVHQGDWEEEEFDDARKNHSHTLELVKRKILDCPFYPNKYPAHASVYKKIY